MNWAMQHPELTIAILSPALLALGYFYRVRVEKRSNLREALYLLLEIWHRVSVLSARSPESMIETLAERMRALYPTANISETEMQATKAHFIPILRRLIRGHALSDMEGLQDAYTKVIHLVARSHPIYAYRLESAMTVKKRFAFLDQYLDEALQPLDVQGGQASVFAAKLRERIGDHAGKDATLDLEKSLRGLAWRVSFASLVEVHRLIKKRRNLLVTDSAAEIDKLLLVILSPMITDPATSAALSPQIDVAPGASLQADQGAR